MQRLINLGHTIAFKIEQNHNCQVCVEAKLTRQPSHMIQRGSKQLDLIHNDVFDQKLVQTRGGNKYFITLVDDSMKHCYIYLLKSKDEALNAFICYKTEAKN